MGAVIAFFGATELVNALMNIGTDLYSRPLEQKSQNYQIGYERASALENERYWRDYEKNTGKKPLYPYRTGAAYDYSTLYNTEFYKRSSQGSLGRNIGSALYGAGLYKYGGRRR